MGLPTTGMYQFLGGATNTLIATTEASLLNAISAYAGDEIETTSEHAQEAVQALKIKAMVDLGIAEGSVAYYYYYDNNSSSFMVIAGQSGLVATNAVQPMRAQLGLLLDSNGNIDGLGECFETDMAFAPAAPFDPEFV